MKNKWGKKKIDRIFKFLEDFVVTDINSEAVIKAYGEIDAYSQGKLAHKPLGNSSRNMGKNDLWIAATGHVTDAKLITSDQDFVHLRGAYIDLAFVDITTKTLE